LLERSLLPPSPPACPGIELATRYAAAAERTVGGDWYDVFTLPSGQLWIVVGDVAGHGLNAAVVMGRIRSALRAYTLLGLPPDQVLDLVDRKVEHFEIGTFATIVCVVADPPYDSLTIATAGHPPPVVVDPDGSASFVAVPVAPPVGTGRGAGAPATTVPFAPGSVIALYTDGLIERRGESIDIGLERLRRAVKPGPPETVARDVMHRLLADVVPFDDVALVVGRRLPES
jgi:serine phosphatase RsbU (regulator of sigma subunit)